MDDTARRRLEAGEPALGAWLASGSPRVAEALAPALDWIGIDAEHTPVGPWRVEAAIRAVEEAATPLVRLPSVEVAAAGWAKWALDAGAGGVIVPGVDSRAAAERAVAAATFPPAGDRGVAGTTRANAYGERFEAALEAAADRLVVVQLESPAAIEHADDILAVEGVDVAFVGENDLSARLGYPGETDRPAVREAVERVRDLAGEHGVHPGIAGRSPETLAERAERGFRFFLLGADVSLARAGLSPYLLE